MRSSPDTPTISFDASGAELTLFADNFSIAYTARLSAEVHEPGRVRALATKLIEIVKHSGAPEISLSTETSEAGNTLLRYRCGEFDALLPTSMVEREPLSAPVTTAHQIESLPLAQLVDLAIPAAGASIYIDGALLEIGADRIALVATDGYRLHRGEFVPAINKNAAVVAELQNVEQSSIVLPVFALRSVKALLSEGALTTTVLVGDRNIVLETGKRKLNIRANRDARFPAYRKWMKTTPAFTCEADRVALIRALKLMALADATVELRFEQTIIAIKSDEEESRTTGTVDASYSAWAPLTVKVNAQFLAQTLDTISTDMVALCPQSDKDPLFVRPVAMDGFSVDCMICTIR